MYISNIAQLRASRLREFPATPVNASAAAAAAWHSLFISLNHFINALSLSLSLPQVANNRSKWPRTPSSTGAAPPAN